MTPRAGRHPADGGAGSARRLPGHPTATAMGLIRLTVLFLPPGADRERYRQEFVSELWGRSRAQQLRDAVGLFAHAPALRLAIATTRPRGSREEHTMTESRFGIAPRVDGVVPVLCALHLHRLVLARNPDGEDYLRCVRCGADRYDVERTSGPNICGNLASMVTNV